MDIGLLARAGQSVSDLYWTWHSAPQTCRDRLLQGFSFCLGSSQQSAWVAAVELGFLILALTLAFVLGRTTAHIPLEWGYQIRRRVVYSHRGRPSRFSRNGGSIQGGSDISTV